MNNIKIGAKLTAAFVTLIVALIATGLYLINGLKAVGEHSTMLYERGAVPLGLLVKTAEQAQELRVLTRELRLAETVGDRDTVVGDINVSQSILKDVIGQQIQLAINAQERQALEELQALVDEYVREIKAYANTIDSDGDHASRDRRIEGIAMSFMDAGGRTIEQKVGSTGEISKDNLVFVNNTVRTSIFILIAAVLVAGLFGLYLIISITQPLKILVGKIDKISEGDMTSRVSLDRGDELGLLARSVDNLASRLQSIMKNLRINSDALAGASEELAAVSRQLASGAEETVAQSNAVASTTEEMAVNINAMAHGAEDASSNANEVAGAAEQMSVNMNTIASAMEEMTMSINQISENTNEVRKVAIEATGKSTNATSAMNELGEAAKEIGQVTGVIKKIADKTNLLALNATIEAASAGEAGKGFAVVASEIKELANQSAQSADDIARRIEGIQTGTNNAVDVIRDVSDIILKINSSVEAISDNVEQQTRASGEIASNVAQANTGARRVASAIAEVARGGSEVSHNASEAAKGATHVSSSIVGMNQAAQDSAQGATQVNQSANDLTKIADELRQTVVQFRV